MSNWNKKVYNLKPFPSCRRRRISLRISFLEKTSAASWVRRATSTRYASRLKKNQDIISLIKHLEPKIVMTISFKAIKTKTLKKTTFSRIKNTIS